MSLPFPNLLLSHLFPPSLSEYYTCVPWLRPSFALFWKASIAVLDCRKKQSGQSSNSLTPFVFFSRVSRRTSSASRRFGSRFRPRIFVSSFSECNTACALHVFRFARRVNAGRLGQSRPTPCEPLPAFSLVFITPLFEGEGESFPEHELGQATC